MTERLGILMRTSNYFQTVEILDQKLTNKNKPEYIFKWGNFVRVLQFFNGMTDVRILRVYNHIVFASLHSIYVPCSGSEWGSEEVYSRSMKYP